MPEFNPSMVAPFVAFGVVTYIVLVVAIGMFLAYRKGYDLLWAFFISFWLNLIGVLWIYLGKPNEQALRDRWTESAPYRAALSLVFRCRDYLERSATLAELRVALGQEGITSIDGRSIAALARDLRWDPDAVQSRLRFAALKGLDRRKAPLSEYVQLLQSPVPPNVQERLALILAEHNDLRGVDVLLRAIHEHAPALMSGPRLDDDDIAKREGLVIGRLFRANRLDPHQAQWVNNNRRVPVYHASGYRLHTGEYLDVNERVWDAELDKYVRAFPYGETMPKRDDTYRYETLPVTLGHCLDLDNPERVLFLDPNTFRDGIAIEGGPYEKYN